MSFLRPALTWLLIWLLAFAAPAQAVRNMLHLDAALTARAEKTGLIRDQVVDRNGDYGETLVDQGSVYNPYRWNGEQLDAESGLTYLRNRYYQAATGRFIQRDPIRYAGGLNLYAYCSGDPIGGSDPDGLQPRPWMLTDPMGANQPKLGRPGFKNPWDYAKVAGGLAMVVPAAGGAARTAQLAYRGVRALGYGRAGILAYFGAHGQEVVDTVEGAMLPAGAPTSSFALGLNVHLDDFAAENGATMAKQFGPDWKATVRDRLSDPAVKVLFNMKGVDWRQAERNVARGGKISATDWELDLIKQNPQWWGTVEFLNGAAPNWFKK